MRLFEGTPFDRPPRCEVCGELEENCTCPPPEPVRTPPSEQTLSLSVEKRKRGKTVTVIRGLAADNDAGELLTHLKSKCGAGGSIQAEGIEIQGNHLERISAALQSKGYRVKQ